MAEAKTFEVPTTILRSDALNGPARVFLAILFSPDADTRELSELTGLPCNQVHTARARLRKKDLLTRKPARWIVASE